MALSGLACDGTAGNDDDTAAPDVDCDGSIDEGFDADGGGVPSLPPHGTPFPKYPASP